VIVVLRIILRLLTDLFALTAFAFRIARVFSTNYRVAPVAIGTTEHNEAAPSHAKLTQGSGRSVGKISDFGNGSSSAASVSPKTCFVLLYGLS
jgi:hypothetical protein